MLLDVNEESINALKMHLIEIIAGHRIYRDEEFEALQTIFKAKN